MMREWFLISTTTLIVTALLCTGLMWMMRGRSRPKSVMAVISTLLSVYMASELVLYYLDYDFRPEKLVFSYSLVCITLACLIWIYFRTLMQPWRSNRKPICRLLCGLAGFIVLYATLSSLWPGSPPLYTLKDIVHNIGHPVVILRVAAFLTFVAMLVVCCLKICRMYFQHKAAIAAQFSFVEQISLSWIPYLIVIYTLYGLWTVFDQFISGNVGWIFIASNFVYAGFYLVINFMGLYQQDVYPPRERDPESRDDAQQTNGNGMPPEVRRKLNAELTALMEQAHEYRNPELRLDGVAHVLNTNRTYLSTVIREDFKENFIGFVNGYRIREAKELLSNRGASLSMSEIAERVGFKSISSFNTFFKRDTGTNPTQYRKARLLK